MLVLLVFVEHKSPETIDAIFWNEKRGREAMERGVCVCVWSKCDLVEAERERGEEDWTSGWQTGKTRTARVC